MGSFSIATIWPTREGWASTWYSATTAASVCFSFSRPATAWGTPKARASSRQATCRIASAPWPATEAAITWLSAASSRFRRRVSSNRRALWTAMAAWVANRPSSSASDSEKTPGSSASTDSTPSAPAPQRTGTPTVARKPRSPWTAVRPSQ